jgi:hypothetical protein
MGTYEPIPLFSSDHPEEPVLPGMLKGWDRSAIRSRLFTTGTLFVTVAAIGFAVHWAGNPVVLFTKATTSLAPRLASPEHETARFVSGNESTGGAQELPPNATAAPKNDETAPVLSSTDRKQTEIVQPTGIWLKQFQAWAAEEDARTPVSLAEPSRPIGEVIQPLETVQAAQPSQPLQDAPAQLLQVRHVQRHRQIGRVQNARAEVVAEQKGRVKVRPPANARAPIRHQQQKATAQIPVQSGRAQSGQGVQPAWLAQRLGWMD